MKQHILIIEDEQDTFENLERKITHKFPEALVQVASSCDKGFDYIKKHKITHPISLMVLDLTFKNPKETPIIKGGKQLLKTLKENNICIPTIVYSSHGEMEHIHPVLNNYHPNGYIIKSSNSSDELLFAMERVLVGENYFSQQVHQQQLQRFKYASNIDEIDEQIIQLLPNTDSIKNWEEKIEKGEIAISYKSIQKRINLLCDRLEVDNEKLLLLKLQRLAVI
jgi:DNA-binding NarL/FixJ family response regulator